MSNLMNSKDPPIYYAAGAAALFGLVLWNLSALQKSHYNQQLPLAAQPTVVEPARATLNGQRRDRLVWLSESSYRGLSAAPG
jgi:hypothetical protein